MAIDNDPLFSLDILGSQNADTSNCILRQNKTKMLVRGDRDYVTTYRNDVLRNRGLDTIEDHQYNWSFKENDYWTPCGDASGNLETWLQPEYFHPETDNPTRCTKASDRVCPLSGGLATSALDFLQNTVNNMPFLVVDTELNNYTVLNFDARASMSPTTSPWQAGTGDFSCHLVLNDFSATDLGIIVAKKSALLGWGLQMNMADGNKQTDFRLADTVIEVFNGGAACIISCGRHLGRQYLAVISAVANNFTTQTETDATNITSGLVQLGKSQRSVEGKLDGNLAELVYYQGALTSDDRDRVQGYLGWKYGIIPYAHTYTDNPPKWSDRFGNNEF